MTKKYNAWSEAMAGALNKNLLKYVKIWNLKPVLIFDHFNIIPSPKFMLLCYSEIFLISQLILKCASEPWFIF